MILAILPLVLNACGSGEEDARLSAFRQAVPSKTQLLAKKPQGTAGNDVGDPAYYPYEAAPAALAINGAVGGIIDLMRAVVDLEPTLYDSTTEQYLWGPYDSDEGFGTVAAYIVKLPEGEDFEYAYALLRGTGNDVAQMVPVIWGAATPDPEDEDNGVGVTLWDFEANYAFAQANDPEFATKPFDRGRFVAVYGAQPDPEKEGARFGFVVAVFRNFIAKDNQEPNPTPADLDYLYGRYQDGQGLRVDFLDFLFAADVDGNDVADLAEDVEVQMAFLNEGWGRAEASAVGGDLAQNQSVAVIECWDDSLARQYANLDFLEDGAPLWSLDEGELANCGPIVEGQPVFANTLDALGMPTLADVDAEMMAALDDVATNGPAAFEE
jgi:hypothetical protein